ncbi:MAG: zinc transporter [Boseongicola sp.]|nr:MAG: zinc transporter [Boseongicola sp.]
MLRQALASLTFLAAARPVAAEAPRVITDIAPVHSLVSMVMGDLGSPDLLVTAGASAHSHDLRPSRAAALQEADAVFWIGEELMPWMEGPINNLASDAMVVELLHTDGTKELEFRETVLFGDIDDDHGNEHGHGHNHGHDHGDEDLDPHAWLDPENAITWIGIIADTMTTADPENAEIYLKNAANTVQKITEISNVAHEKLAGKEPRYVVFHDAYQYFEARFSVGALAAISLSDASAPGPARLAEIRENVLAVDVKCALSEPTAKPGLLDLVFEGLDVKVYQVDPLGSAFEPGPALYGQLIQSMTDALANCS